MHRILIIMIGVIAARTLCAMFGLTENALIFTEKFNYTNALLSLLVWIVSFAAVASLDSAIRRNSKD